MLIVECITADCFSHSGGLEMLFANERKHSLTLPATVDDGKKPTISYLIEYLVKNVMKDQRKELFVVDNNV